MAIEIATPRGIYRLAPASPLETGNAPGPITLTLAIERADGIERVLVEFLVERDLLGAVAPNADAIIERLKGWLEREFEATREAALKAIRTERRLHQILFDSAHPGPFHS
ncbi:MAG TPA: hypothetical protein VJN94_12955 [Candidatus Binataceae bacterium]|nr:hypothetical protein [Candidatus Binataceae bacterium]